MSPLASWLLVGLIVAVAMAGGAIKAALDNRWYVDYLTNELELSEGRHKRCTDHNKRLAAERNNAVNQRDADVESLTQHCNSVINEIAEDRDRHFNSLRDLRKELKITRSKLTKTERKLENLK